jgi:Cu/Ag efflux protein CusF
MKKILAAATAFSILGAVFAAAAQEQAAVAVTQTEAVVKVVKIDRKARTVTFRGPQGREMTLAVPKEAQNFDRVKVGSAFKVRYVEAVAVAMQRGGTASASADRQVRLAPKGGTPGGVVVDTARISATIEAIDVANRKVAVKGPTGNVMAFRVADDVQGLNEVKVGDSITLVYTQALALEMQPEQSGGKAKAAPKKD